MTVEENILAILETRRSRPGRAAQAARPDAGRAVDQAPPQRSKAYSLSGGERRRLEITRALVTDPKFMLLDEPFAGVDPIAVHDIQTIVAGLRHRGIGVLITDHNVEQTLDIVDRAYIMFEGKVQASGTVRDLVYDDRVAQLYLGPHPDRAAPRPARGGGMKTGLSQHTSLRQELRVNPRLYQAMDMLYMPMMDLQQHLKQELLANPFLELLEPEEETPEQKDSEQEKEQKEKEEEMDWEEILLNGFEVGGTREQFEQLEYTEPVTVETKRPDRPSPGAAPDAHADPAPAAAGRGVPRQHQRGGLPRGVAGGDPELGEPAGGRARAGGDGRRKRRRRTGSEPCGTRRRPRRPPSGRKPRPQGEAPAAPVDDLRPALYSMAEIEEMLGIIQKLDPPGIGARDLRECLLIQLREEQGHRVR